VFLVIGIAEGHSAEVGGWIFGRVHEIDEAVSLVHRLEEVPDVSILTKLLTT